MKARIIENGNFAGIYTSDFIEKNLDHEVNGEFVKDWKLIGVLPPTDLIKPIWQDNQWKEGATPEELETVALNQLQNFLTIKEKEGSNYFNEINVKITAALIGLERVTLFSILEEIDTILYPPLMKIKTGDFASALLLFNRQTPPTNAMLLQYYNEAKQYALEYYNMKYPK